MIFLFTLSIISHVSAYVYSLQPEELDAVLETLPAAVIYYMEGHQLSEHIRANFIEASERLKHLGVLFGSFNCVLDPERCKNSQIRSIPEIRLHRSDSFFSHISIIFIIFPL